MATNVSRNQQSHVISLPVISATLISPNGFDEPALSYATIQIPFFLRPIQNFIEVPVFK